MDPVEKQYRAERYRIEIFDTHIDGYPQYDWVKYRVYRPRKWFRGRFYFHGSFTCGRGREDAYRSAEAEAKKIIQADIKHRYDKKNKGKTSNNTKTVYVEV